MDIYTIAARRRLLSVDSVPSLGILLRLVLQTFLSVRRVV
jgi:hypothetical protein